MSEEAQDFPSLLQGSVQTAGLAEGEWASGVELIYGTDGSVKIRDISDLCQSLALGWAHSPLSLELPTTT